MSSTGATARDGSWKTKEQGDEARYANEKEQAQLASLRDQLAKKGEGEEEFSKERDFEGGHGGQEDLEDRYAATSGEH
ncbi:hypothetical protein E1B28_002521 [Marasmius oreades]|uniref:Uncharacterized protein n=1 Tax=Marasmius oreades TaxID=181124 RepID=A0A9P7RNT5_9AGAR|nr:uncharacterized protein E1B28_002521 [Marasmius oreades]KAG7086575.1 hypothetical protein E1B28_002521 [Marasmius oreades]